MNSYSGQPINVVVANLVCQDSYPVILAWLNLKQKRTKIIKMIPHIPRRNVIADTLASWACMDFWFESLSTSFKYIKARLEWIIFAPVQSVGEILLTIFNFITNLYTWEVVAESLTLVPFYLFNKNVRGLALLTPTPY